MAVTTSGYPDYQRVSAQAGDVLYSVQQQIGGGYVSPMLDAHGYGYLDVSVNAIGGTGFFWISISWQANSSGNAEVSTFAFTPTPGGEQTLQVPVVSRYFQMALHYLSGVTTDAPFVSIFGTNVAHAPAVNSQPARPFLWAELAIGAGATMIATGTTTIQGAAVLSITDSGTEAWSALVQFYDQVNNGWEDLMILFSAQWGQTATLTIGVPPAPIRVQVTNSGTASHSFWVSIGVL